MTAENVGVKYLRANTLLAGVDHLGLRGGAGDLFDVPGFDRIAEDDAHK
jgi:hypothetical protein